MTSSWSLFRNPDFSLANPAAQELFNNLVAAYDQTPHIRFLLSKTSIREADITMTGAVRDVWLGLLRHAARGERLRELVEVAVGDDTIAAYHPRLQRLLDDDVSLPEQAPRHAPASPVGRPAGDKPVHFESASRAFLCHSSGDKELVRQLYRRLQSDGVPCWFDEEDLLPGQDWEYEIGKAIRASRFILACLSQASVSKTGYVQKELARALDVAQEQQEGAIFLIPVRLEDCEIPQRLRRWQWVDLFSGEPAYARLLQVLRRTSSTG